MPDFKDLVTQYGQGASAYLWYQGESDANLQGIPVYKDRLKSMVEIAGATLDKAAGALRDQSVDIPLARTGYIQPSRIRVDGLSLVLDLPVSAKPGATISYGLVSTSLCSLVDEANRPAATFADMGIQEAAAAAPDAARSSAARQSTP